MILDGYDPVLGKFEATGALRLIDSADVEAASWSFVKLMDHWKRKHAHAVYVPCQGRTNPDRSYWYSNTVLLAEGAQFRRFLQALSNGLVYYDPGIKLEDASSQKAKVKLRSQIRIGSGDLPALYQSTEVVSVNRHG